MTYICMWENHLYKKRDKLGERNDIYIKNQWEMAEERGS